MNPVEPKVETKMQKLEKFNGVYQSGFDDGLKAGMQRAVEMNVVKELTDDEIHELANEHLRTQDQDGAKVVLGLEDFARAILRKAQEK